ncbi:MAG TPA: hypothetical protein DCZ03_05795 [Gammaproteobacteria bacterium]|nr:hypothetical protein [Gammaproteobacteria bacterium]
MSAPPLVRYFFLSLTFLFTSLLQAATSEDDRLLAIYDSSNVEEMIAKLDQLIEDFPQSYRAYAFRSMMFLEADKPRLALDDCYTAIKLNPSFPYTYVICAQVTAELGDFSASRAFFLKAEQVGENYMEEPTENQSAPRPSVHNAPRE